MSAAASFGWPWRNAAPRALSMPPPRLRKLAQWKPRQLLLTSPRWTWRQLLLLLQARRGALCVEGAHGSGSASGKRTRKRLLLLHLQVQPGFQRLEGQLTAPQVALPVWRWARGVQGRVSGHCRRRRWRMAAPTCDRPALAGCRGSVTLNPYLPLLSLHTREWAAPRDAGHFCTGGGRRAGRAVL